MSGRDAAGGAVYNMCPPLRSKKMAGLGSKSGTVATGHFGSKMVRIGLMARRKIQFNRRVILAGLGTAAIGSILPVQDAFGAQTALFRAKPDSLTLQPGVPGTPIWSLEGPWLTMNQPDTLKAEFQSDLPIPAVLNWRGLGGAPSVEPLLAQRPLDTGGGEKFELSVRRAGTLFCDLGLLGDGQARPCRGLPIVLRESPPAAVDRDETLLFEEWRLRADGRAIAPGIDPKETTILHTLNGKSSLDISARSNERIRLRLINGSPRSVIAIKLDSVEVRVMAIDSQPAEPFLARNGALVLPPGGRIDAFVDLAVPAGAVLPIHLHDGRDARQIGRLLVSNDAPARATPLPPAAPLPANGLPARLDLKNALRVDLPLGPPSAGWVAPSGFAPSAPPAFRAKKGRVVVLALTNRNRIAAVFHLHGHHFRLLDRLDDGWKPFWLDTLAIEPGQTQRIAFAAEYAGRWLLESVATNWAAPRLVRWYAVE